MEVTRISIDNEEYFRGVIPQDILADNQMLHLGVIDDDGTACGGMSMIMSGEMAHIEWLYIYPTRRGKGMATELLGSLIMLLKSIKGAGMEISFTDDCQGLEYFLEDAGFLIGNDSQLYSVPVNDLIYSATMEHIEERKLCVGRVFTLNQMKNKRDLYQYLEDKGIDGTHLEKISQDCSIVRMNKKNEIRGCMLLRIEEDEAPQVTWFYNDDYIVGLDEMLLLFRDVMIKYDMDRENIIFIDRDDQIIDFIEQVTDVSREFYYKGGRHYGVRLLDVAR